MDPWVHLDPNDNPRLNPAVLRGSDEERLLFNKRSCVERIFGYMKGYGGLDRRPYRRRHIFQIVGLCHALAIHAKAWVKALFADSRAKGASLLDRLKQIFEIGRAPAT